MTPERLQQIARKLRTYAAIYTGDKEAREMARDCEAASAVGANVGAGWEALRLLASLNAMSPPEGVALNLWLSAVTGARAAVRAAVRADETSPAKSADASKDCANSVRPAESVSPPGPPPS